MSSNCGCIVGSVAVPYKYSDLGDKPSINGKKIEGDVALDAGDVLYDSAETYEAGTVGAALQSGGSGAIGVAVTLASADWSGSTQTVTVSEVSATSNVIVTPDPASMEDYVEAGIVCTAQDEGELTFTCDTVPSNDIVVNLLIQ